MTAQRLARPGSKLACHDRWLERIWLPPARDLALDQLYRALDILAEHGDAIEQEMFWPGVDLFDVGLILLRRHHRLVRMRRRRTSRPRAGAA